MACSVIRIVWIVAPTNGVRETLTIQVRSQSFAIARIGVPRPLGLIRFSYLVRIICDPVPACDKIVIAGVRAALRVVKGDSGIRLPTYGRNPAETISRLDSDQANNQCPP